MAKRGENIYKRKDGRWEGRYIIGHKSNGQTRYASVYARSYREVKEILGKKKGERFRALPSCSLTVKVVMEMWLALRSTDVKESTYQRYLMLIEKHILPQLGNLRISVLTAQVLTGFVAHLMRSGRTDGRGGLSEKSVNDILCVLRSGLRLAGRKYAVGDGSLFDVKAPTPRTKPVETLGSLECETLTQGILADPDLSGAAYLLGLNFGLRIGEVCGLKWEDVDFSKRELAVNRTVLRIQSGMRTQVVVQTPKTESSVRVIPLTAEMLLMLARLKNTKHSDAYMLTGSRTKPLEPRALQYRFRVFLKKHGMKQHHFHTLRHTFATRSIERGFDPKTLSELLGHSNVKTTLQLYSEFYDKYYRDPSKTSFGDISMQLGVAANTLGIGPENLDLFSEMKLASVLSDPKMSIMFAARHLAQLKNIDFPDIPSHELTLDEMKVIANRYNMGSSLSLETIAQYDYGSRFWERMDDFKNLW